MTAAQSELIDRLRSLLADESSSREVAMFGGRAFMVNEKMIVSALREGDLLVRVAAERHDELCAYPGVSQAEMGAGRSMGPGWIEVSLQAIDTDDALSFWLAAALEHNAFTSGSRGAN